MKFPTKKAGPRSYPFLVRELRGLPISLLECDQLLRNNIGEGEEIQVGVLEQTQIIKLGMAVSEDPLERERFQE